MYQSFLESLNSVSNLFPTDSYNLSTSYDFIETEEDGLNGISELDKFAYIPYNMYTKLYNYWKEYVELTYSPLILNSDEKILSNEINNLILYSAHLIRLQEFKIYDYKQDVFGNHFTLFKHREHTKYEDSGEIWLRYKNYPLSFPLMKAIEFLSDDEAYNDQIQYENTLNIFLNKYDQLQCDHKLYTKILKQMVNNCIQFQVFDDTIVVLGYTNYIKYNNQIVRNKNKYLKLVVFKIIENNSRLSVYTPSIRFITPHEYMDYLSDINEYIISYKNNDKLCFNLYDIESNNNNVKNLKTMYKYGTDKFLLDIPLTFTYVSYDLKNYVLNIETKTYNNMKYPIIGLMTDNICTDTEPYNHHINHELKISEKNQSIWKATYQDEQIHMAYESVNSDLLKDSNGYPYQELYNTNRMVIDIFIITCKLIYKTINDDVFPVLDKINISVGYDIIESHLSYDELTGGTGEDGLTKCNAVELNAIHQKYPICNMDHDNNLIIKTIATKMGGIKNYNQDITHDLTGLDFIRNSIHFIKADEEPVNYLQKLLLLDNLTGHVPSFRAGLSDLALALCNNTKLLAKTNLISGHRITDVDIIHQITDGLKNDISSVTEGFTYNVNLLKSDDNDYIATTPLIKFLPAITYCMLDDMKIIINFGNLTPQIRNFITGLESFDLDTSVFIDDSSFDNRECLKRVGWHCGYVNTDYIDWNSGDERYGGPEILTIHLKKYYNYLFNKYKSNYDKAMILQKDFLNIAKSILLKINVCWYNESMLIGINPNIEIFWNGVYYKKIVNSDKMNFNIGCCENSYQEVVKLDMVNNTFNLTNFKCYTVNTTFDLRYPKANLEYHIMPFNTLDDVYAHITTNNEYVIKNGDGYIETITKVGLDDKDTYVNDALLRRRHWYIYDIEQVMYGSKKIGVSDQDIIDYFHNCLTYSYDDIIFHSAYNNNILDNPVNFTIPINFNADYIPSDYDKHFVSGVSAIKLDNVSNDANTYGNVLQGVIRTYLNGYFFDDNINITKKYYAGNIFANRPEFVYNCNWGVIDDLIYCKTITKDNNYTSAIIIPSSILKTFTYAYKPDIYYNEVITPCISAVVSTITTATVVPNINCNEGIEFNSLVNSGIYATNLEENNLYSITVIPYYQQKQRLVYDMDNQHTYTLAYYPKLMTFTDQFQNILSGNNLDVVLTYLPNTKFFNIFEIPGDYEGKLSQFTFNSGVTDIEVLSSYMDTIKLESFNTNLYPLVNSDKIQELNIPIYQNISTAILGSTVIKVGNIHVSNIFKGIHVSTPDHVYVVAQNNAENVNTTLNFDYSVNISSVNKYNDLNNEYTDIAFNPYGSDLETTLESLVKIEE